MPIDLQRDHIRIWCVESVDVSLGRGKRGGRGSGFDSSDLWRRWISVLVPTFFSFPNCSIVYPCICIYILYTSVLLYFFFYSYIHIPVLGYGSRERESERDTVTG